MKKLVLVLAAILAVALAAVPGAVARPDGAAADPGLTRGSITVGATLPLSGPASLYARIGTGMRAYFSYINARRARSDGKRGRLRPADRPQGLRRRLPGGPDRPADAARGRAGPRLRDARRARDREPAGHPRVHEPAQGPAALRLDRPQRVRPALPAEPVDDRLAAGLRPGGHPPRALRPREPPELAGRGAPPERRLRPGVRSRASRARPEPAASSRPRPIRVAAAPPSSPVPTARLRASGADTFLMSPRRRETITALVVAYRLGWRPNKLVNSVGATDTYMTAVRELRRLA